MSNRLQRGPLIARSFLLFTLNSLSLSISILNLLFIYKCLKYEIENGFHESNQAKLSPKSGYQNAAQLEMISKLKNKHNAAPLSPLALSNVKNEKGTILIKKRKNVPSATVSTQTDDSYLLTEYHNRLKH